MIALAFLAFMILNGNHYGFWYDEFAQICFSGGSQTLLDSLLVVDPTPPLFNVLANIWYHIVPYGERWLLLLPQLATAGGVYISALWGERLGGQSVGVWTAILLGASQMVMEQCGFEFRSYGIYLLFSALAFYIHCRLMERELCWIWEIGYFGALIGLLYSHAFGVLLVAALGLIDLIQIGIRRKHWRSLIPYVAAGCCYLPWLVQFFYRAGTAATNAVVGWMQSPTLWDIIKLLAYLCGNHIVVCGLFAAGTAVLIIWVFQKQRGEGTESLIQCIPLLVSGIVVCVAFLYGIIQGSQASLWEKRYFTGLFPCAAVICGMGATAISRLLQRYGMVSTRIFSVVCAGLVVPVFLVKTAVGDTPLGTYYHREVAEVLYQQNDIREEHVLILSTMDQFISGWEEYYGSHQGRREELGIRSIYDVTPKELQQYDVIYFENNFWEERSRTCPTRQMLETEYNVSKSWDEIHLQKYEKKNR